MKRIIYAACAAATLALALPAVQTFADTAAPTALQQEQGNQRREEWMQRRAEIFDAFLVGYKASLGLTNDQEKNWAPFELALREAAKRGPERDLRRTKSAPDRRPRSTGCGTCRRG